MDATMATRVVPFRDAGATRLPQLEPSMSLPRAAAAARSPSEEAVTTDFARSPGLARMRPQAVVCLMTFRRPLMLRDTLDSLIAQVDSPEFAIVVVENDADGCEGAAVAKEYLETARIAGICVIEPRPGNCQAANRAFGEARQRFPEAEFVLMIDDDEIADPRWLSEIVGAARATGADIVGGPVLPRFPEGAPARLAEHPIYWPAYDRTGPVEQIWGSGNFLIRRDAYSRLDNPDFDLAYNFLGGGDNDFFTRCRRAGLKFYWANEARITETVPAGRLKSRWMIQRGLRLGAINYRVERSTRGALGSFLRSLAHGPLALWRAARLLLQGKATMIVLHPVFIFAGRFLAMIDRTPEQYRVAAGKRPT